jgi:hypothetical protein
MVPSVANIQELSIQKHDRAFTALISEVHRLVLVTETSDNSSNLWCIRVANRTVSVFRRPTRHKKSDLL